MTGLAVEMLLDPFCKATSSANNVYSLITNISTYNSSGITQSLVNLDIEASLRVVEKLISELNIEGTETLKISIKLLNESIYNIEQILIDIHEKLAYNRNIRLSFLRGYWFSDSIIQLATLKGQLDNRIGLLNMAIGNYHNLTKKVKDPLLSDMSIIEKKY